MVSDVHDVRYPSMFCYRHPGLVGVVPRCLPALRRPFTVRTLPLQAATVPVRPPPTSPDPPSRTARLSSSPPRSAARYDRRSRVTTVAADVRKPRHVTPAIIDACTADDDDALFSSTSGSGMTSETRVGHVLDGV